VTRHSRNTATRRIDEDRMTSAFAENIAAVLP
jgi:hypothetical protein